MASAPASPPPGSSPAVSALTGTEQLRRAQEVFLTALLHVGVPSGRDGGDIDDRHEPGRVLGVLEGEEIVATAESYGSWMVVPGGARIPHAAVTGVGVLATHTRRGLLSALMRHQLADIAARGEVVASLRASEGGIYERFGYGVATRRGRFELIRERAALRPTLAAGAPVRLVDLLAGEPLLREVRDRENRVGAVGRTNAMWANLHAWESARSAGPRHVVVSDGGRDGGTVDGYAVYGPPGAGGWASNPELRVRVHDMVALTDSAYLGLIRHLMTLDLTRIVEFDGPIDDPLGELVRDPTAVESKGSTDETWLRLVDVGAALAQRSYNPGGPVTLAVEDPLLEANSGAYAIAGDGAARIGADATAEVSVGVAALAAAYLGGTPWRDLALAGRAVEHREGAIGDLDALFAVPRAPYCGTSF